MVRDYHFLVSHIFLFRFEISDLHIEEKLPYLISVSETYIQIYERNDEKENQGNEH